MILLHAAIVWVSLVGHPPLPTIDLEHSTETRTKTMSTNYYVKQTTCDHCGHTPEEAHIGKNSAGWEFVFQATEKCRCYEDWCDSLQNKIIVDEYGREVSFEEFYRIVQNSVGGKNHHNYCTDKGHVGTFNDADGWAFIENEFS
jgi:hypothetical protein